MTNDRKDRSHAPFWHRAKRTAAWLVLAVLLGVCLIPDHSRAVTCGMAEFLFLDVGQGDASLIRTESGCILIDSGTNLSEDALVAQLKQLDISRIDCLILTHSHEDHIGGADRVLQEFDVPVVMFRDAGESDAVTGRLREAIRRSGADIITPTGITTYDIGQLRLDVIVPFAEPQVVGNDSSLIVRICFGETIFLYMGDAEAASERVLLARFSDGNFLNCDGLKLGHHGSNTSSTPEFLDAVSPQYAIVSDGAGNSFGHPHERVLADLAARGCMCLRTDEHGAILLISDGEKLWIGDRP